MSDDIERIAQALYHADLDYDGSGDKYRHLAKAVYDMLQRKPITQDKPGD